MRQNSRRLLAIAVLLPGAGMFVSFSVAGGQDINRVPAAQSAGITMQSAGFLPDSVKPDSVKRRPRPRAKEHSDWNARRLLIHRVGSYTKLPLFATQ